MSSTSTSKKPRGSAKARRSAARLAAVQCLYEMAVADRPAADIVGEFIQFRIGQEVDGATFVPADVTLLTAIVRGADAEATDIASLIDGAIRAPLEHGRLELLLKSILAAGVWELRRNLEVPAPIIISEYVSIAVAFYGGPEPGLINGVLDRVARQLRSHEFGQGGAGPIPGGKPEMGQDGH
ncbi:MAG TPA: transcription antitermination factor NusB [Alphaproteobacteria bacterium]|nr:transcription antitermination factor NusB [Alphaproteobacteria bacterium]